MSEQGDSIRKFLGVLDTLPTINVSAELFEDDDTLHAHAVVQSQPAIVISSVVQVSPAQTQYSAHMLMTAPSLAWRAVAEELGADWSKATQISPRRWEEIVAEAYLREGYQVILTPPSGDGGVDIIATKDGLGSIKILGSVKAYKPGHLVDYDHVRAMIGVLHGPPHFASKGIITTTSDFRPRIMQDQAIAPLIPYRLELMNGQKLQAWLRELLTKSAI